MLEYFIILKIFHKRISTEQKIINKEINLWI